MINVRHEYVGGEFDNMSSATAWSNSRSQEGYRVVGFQARKYGIISIFMERVAGETDLLDEERNRSRGSDL